jgi:MraZ protein
MGGLICLFGLVLACKLRDGNKAIAQDDKSGPTPPPLVEPSIPPVTDEKENEPIPSLPKMDKAALETASPPLSDKSQKDSSKSGRKSEPKATMEMPLPTPSSAPLPALADEKGQNLSAPPPPLPSPPSGGLLPASFGPNTPAPKSEKKEEEKAHLPPPVGQPFGDDPKDLSTADKKSGRTPGAPTWNKPSDAPPFAPPASKPSGEKPESKPIDKMAPPPSAPSSPLSPPPSVPPSPPSPPTSPIPVGSEVKVTPTSFAPVSAAPPSAGHETADHEAKMQPGEPPLAPAPGPVQTYHVHGSETLQDIARRTLGSSDRVSELHKLNPTLKLDAPLSAGTTVRLPGDACVQTDDAEPVKPLPALRAKPAPPKAKVLPLTGTYQCSLDEKGQLTLPRAIRDQFGGCDTVLLSPGPDKCLWLTNQPHLERLGERLEQSQANEADVRVFKRLYFAQTEKLPVNGEGRVGIPERLAQFAGLHQEVVLVGIDDHFEVWDAARWRQYTQQKSAGHSSSAIEE